MRILAIFWLLIIPVLLRSQDPIVVGLFYGADHVRATVTVQKGGYDIYGDGIALAQIQLKESADITASGNVVNVFFKGKNYTGYSKIEFIQNTPAEFGITPAGHKSNSRLYKENLLVLAYSGRLQMSNQINVEDYVAGVIEAESGSGSELEYYKVQAIISRTYALNNMRRHTGEGFNVCDATHCQVYHGKPRSEKKADIAAQLTKDLVIVDHNIELITAAFHSNCGGHTINAEDVWSKPLNYLVGCQDTFCLKMPHSNWEKTFHSDKWNNYLQSQRKNSVELATLNESIGPRNTYFAIDSTYAIPRKAIREDFKLRSTYFTVAQDGENVQFFGQGFGHGVGLCQEGAMRMAQLNRRYDEIIHFYYKDVHIIPRYMIWFFRD